MSAYAPPAVLPAAFAAAVGDTTHVVGMKPRKGHVLLYRNHQPGGMFLVTKGSVEVCRDGNRRDTLRRSADRRSLLVPGPEDLGDILTSEVTAGDGMAAWFLPRTLLLERPELPELLRGLGVEVISLR